MTTRILQFFAWLYGEARLVKNTQAQLLLSIALSLSAFIGALGYAARITSVIRDGAPPPTLPADSPGMKFGLNEDARKALFAELAVEEPKSRAGAASRFPSQPWSAEDDRGAFERTTVTTIAAKHHMSLTQVYLVLDEGIREHWLGPDGEPLSPRTVPLHPRRKY